MAAAYLEDSFEATKPTNNGYDNSGWGESEGGSSVVDSDCTSVARPPGGGDQVLQINCDGTQSYTYKDLGGDKDPFYFTVYYRVESANDGIDTEIVLIEDASWAQTVILKLARSGSTYTVKLRVFTNGASAEVDTKVISTETWYKIDIMYSATGMAWEWRVNDSVEGSGNLTGTVTDGGRYCTLQASAVLNECYDRVWIDDSEYGYGGGTPVTVEPTEVGVNATIPTPTIAGSAVDAPNALAVSSVVNDPTVSGEVVEVVPSDLTLRPVLNAVTIIGSATIAAAVLAGSLGINAPTISGQAVTIPEPPAAHVLIVDPDISGDVLETVNAINATFGIPSPTIIGDALVSPNVVSGTTSIPPPTISGSALIAPNVLSCHVSLIGTTVYADVTVRPPEDSGTLSIPTPTITTTVGGTPVAKTGTTSFASSANSGTQAITVPSDTSIALLFIHGINSGGNTWDYCRIDGATMTLVEGTDFSSTYIDTWIYKLAEPTWGSVNFTWDFTGSSAFGSGCWFNFVFLQGEDSSDPIRDHGTDSDSPGSITLDSVEHDYIVGGCASLNADADAAPTGSGQTEFLDTGTFNSVQSACGDEAAESDSVIWQYEGAGTKNSGGAVSVKPSAGHVTTFPRAVVGTLSHPTATITGDALSAITVLSRQLEFVEPDIIVEGAPVTSVTVYPAIVNVDASLPTPTIIGHSLTTPSVLTRHLELIASGADVDITLGADPITINAVVLDVEITEGITVGPSVLSRQLQVLDPFIIAVGDVIFNATEVTANVVIPTPEVLTNFTVVADVPAGNFTIPAPTLIGDALVSPNAVVVTASIPTPTVYDTAKAEPDVVSGGFNIPTPSILTTVVYVPDAVVGTFSIPEPTALGGDQTVSVTPVTAVFSVPASTVPTDQYFTGPSVYRMYLGTSSGGVHEFSATNKGDDTSAILCYWESRRLDFSDKYPDLMRHKKILSKIKLIYTDDNETDVTISVSDDGGVTWTDRTKTIGSGTGYVAEADYFFWISGQYLNVKLTHSSASDTFQWHEMILTFVPGEKHFEVS